LPQESREMSNKSETGKSAEQLRREREQRITDAIKLKIPDRVPVVCELGFFVAKYAGIPCSAAYYDCDAWLAAYRKTLKDFQPDMAFTRPFTAGKALEYLDPKFVRWPGHGVDPHHGMQTIEVESLQDDEYDLFINKSPDFMIRKHLPRLYGSLQAFSLIPELSATTWIEPWAAQTLAMLVTEPQFEATIEKLQKAGRELRKYQAKMEEFNRLLLEFGIPQLYQLAAMPPYDVISHGVRA